MRSPKEHHSRGSWGDTLSRSCTREVAWDTLPSPLHHNLSFKTKQIEKFPGCKLLCPISTGPKAPEGWVAPLLLADQLQDACTFVDKMTIRTEMGTQS